MARGIRAALAALMVAGLAAMAPAPANAAWYTGRNIVVDQAADGSVIALGDSVQLNSTVAGSAVLISSSATVNGTVADSLIVVSGSTTLSGQVGGDVVLVAGNIDMVKGSVVSGDATLLGGEVTMDGTVTGDVAVKGGDLTVSGTIMGDVDATSGKLILKPGAHIMGDVTFSGGQALELPAGAHIEGKVQYKGDGVKSHRHHDADADEESGTDTRGNHHSGWHIWMPWFGGIGMISFGVGMLLVGAVLYILFPGAVTNVAAGIAGDPGPAAVKGLVLLVGVPLFSMVCLITIIGIPVALVLGFAYVLALMVAMPLAGFALADMVTQRRGPPVSPGDRIRRYALVVLILAVLQLIPFVGGLVKFGLLMMGLGGLVSHLRRRGPVAAY
ncbi:polymer-forming cytoskeletal protein [Nitrospirillum sp. BR 11828]|uniref:bactofilin family protein n=1 Tax=Nitrospirillum sp. BR 11828 TaxID=3104325 RepID=UPI002ACA72F9|nr:polymer-forming cytoskeletal protein [Nitrospirillum sp. BR 11828]MDZ5646105.1 polymer-forming cytoskeletal protein [Nitrospirillum sp. BR 11828]